MAGAVPQAHGVTEDGTRFQAHLLQGQNPGLLWDMTEGRRWLRAQRVARPGQKLLNLFAYTCAFSVLALQAGAARVVNADIRRIALAIGKQNHRLNGLAGSASF